MHNHILPGNYVTCEKKNQVNLFMRFQTCTSKSKSKTVTSTYTDFHISSIFLKMMGPFFFACLKTIIEFSIQAFRNLKPISFFSPLKVKCPSSVVPAFSWEREYGKVASAYSPWSYVMLNQLDLGMFFNPRSLFFCHTICCQAKWCI